MVRVQYLENDFLFRIQGKVRQIWGLSGKVERHLSKVIRVAQLLCRKLPEGSNFEDGLRHWTTGKLSVSTQQ